MRVAFLTVDARAGSVLGDSPQPYLGAAPEALLQGFAQLPASSVEVHVVSCVKTSLPAPHSLAPNVHYHQLVLPSWSFLRMLHAGPILAVRRLLATLKPDIVHAQGVERWCAVSGVLSGYPNLLTVHGHLRLIMRRTTMTPVLYWHVQMLLGEWAIRRARGVVAISTHIRNAVRKSARQSWLIANAVRKPFISTPIADLHSKTPKLLVIGTITQNKRPLELLDTFTTLWKSGYRFHVSFIGSLGSGDSYSDAFRDKLKAAQALGLADQFDYLDVQSLIQHLDMADALIHFPLEEAFGLVVAEGLSRNLKLFASRIGGIVDIATGVPSAELFHESDFDGLGRSIAQWLDADCPRAISSAEIIRDRYAPVRVAEQTLDVYREVIAQASSSS